MSYKRGIENTDRAVFNGAGVWEIPCIKGVPSYDVTMSRCVAYNYVASLAKKDENCGELGVHFFLDDYQFERLWRSPETYLPILARFKYVCAPDFSLYTDHPKAVQLFNWTIVKQMDTLL